MQWLKLQEIQDMGYIPDILKPVWVTPIWKGVDREETANYCPISIINHVLKVIERIVRQQIANFLSHNQRLSEDQHGARSGRSTVTQLLDKHHFVLDIQLEGKNVDCIYLDFAKAYDLVDLSVLLMKIKQMGIQGNLLKWI